ncbi:hypothetical protein VTN77DRAFT_9471 [Rasamsonia byssochlamydoides]|uniref:uncharacterized protein n=1 Tax=Rasamsonia byssochlamydoides TaxID=89139 RepID=UPI00374337DE
MSPPLLELLDGPSLPKHCEPASEFLTVISSRLHICIPSTLALISTILGCLSIVSWLFAQLPQIYKNYKLQSTAGLSVFFLVEWCLGDTANLVGALFTRQAGWQVIIASYYVFVDVVLVFQYFWYTYVRRQRKGKIGLDSVDYRGSNADVLEGIAPSEDGSIQSSFPGGAWPSEPKAVGLRKGNAIDSPQFYSPSYSNEKSNSRRATFRTGSGSLPTISPKTVLLTSMLCAVLANATPTGSPSGPQLLEDTHDSATEVAGRVLSWMSTVLYLGSRLPQLYKNYCRKSTSGLSPLLFMAAFSGNFFYSASLLTNPNAWYDFPPYGGGGWADADGNNRWEWVGLAIPFFLGAAGVLSLDAFMGVQFLIYGEQGEEPVVRVSDPRGGRSRWRRVSGWMRGWIPSGDKEPTAPDEARALLAGVHDRYGAV